MPSRCPKFEFDRELGRGTTGRVRLARLTEPFAGLPAGAEVAVKELRRSADDPRAREAFAREARAGRATEHPHLVRVLHEGEGRDGPYLLMQYVPGRSLRQALLEHGRMPEPQVRSVIRQVAAGLGALHAAGWSHGDVKPENVRLDARGGAVLLDLGFARPTGEDCADPAPRAGSLHYLSPEQARGAQAGPASDVYALGVMLHELATGEHPFQPSGDGSASGHGSASGERQVSGDGAASAERWLAAIRAGGQVTPSHRVPRLSPFFDALTRACLESKPDRRPSAATLALILDQGEAGTWWRWRIAFDSDSRRDTVARPGSSSIPFVGRDRELAQLGDLFEQARARDGGGGAAWLEGVEGSGKSRLVSEFVHRVRRSDDPPLYLYGRCTESDEDRPGQPIRRLLQRWLHLPRYQGVGPRERELLAELVPAEVCQSLVTSLEPEGLSTSPMAEAAALAEWLVRLGTSDPLIVFLDDLTFAGEVTLEILGQVAARLRGSRTLLLLGLRWGTPARSPVIMENLRARLATHVPTATLALPALDQAAVLELVEELFHHTTPRLRLARALHERSAGSPGVIAEMVRGLRARGQARPHRDEQYLELLISPDELPLPRSVGRLIADRYQELPAPQRLWLQRLAVVGGNLESAFLLRAFPATTPAQLDLVLTTLVDEGWLTPAGNHYRFARPAQREAVLRGLSTERRMRIHAAAANALQELTRERPSVGLAFQRAYHLHAAGKNLELSEVILPLVARARESGHPSRVHTLATWGLEAIEALAAGPERERQRLELLEAAADAADRLGRRAQQRGFLDRLSDLEIDAESMPRDVGRVYLLHGRYAANTGQYGLSRAMLRNAVLLFRRADDRRLECAATLRLAYVQGHVGEVTEAQRLADQAFELAADDVQRARAHLARAVVAIVSDQFERALRNIDRAMALLRHRDDPTGGRGALAAA
ncbi:MAG: protein kinase, partial [Planctomycetota bacterium]